MDKKTTRNNSGSGAKKGTTSSLPPMAKERKEGGVEVLIERTITCTTRVRARRCNIGDGTNVKEMSEDVIIRSLKKAVGAWANSQPGGDLEIKLN